MDTESSPPPAAGRPRGTALAEAVAAAEALPEIGPDERHLILVDGSGYIFRAYHALPPMTNPDGVPVNAVYGFTQMLAQFLTRHVASHIAVVFDAARETFRNAIYPAYKAHRPDPPPDLVPQFTLIREATDALGIPRVQQEGFEADDLIAAYTKAFLAAGPGRVTIVSSDKDLMQLIRPGVQLLDPIRQKPLGEAEVIARFGVPPAQLADVLALAGDTTDNIPGVPGIGVKTAAQLITEYGDLETLLAHAAELRQPKRREALLAHAEAARLSKRLVVLDDNAPLPLPLEALRAQALTDHRLEDFLRAMGFRSLLARLGRLLEGEAKPQPGAVARMVAPGPPPPDLAAAYGPYETVTSEAALSAWIAAAQAAGVVAFDTETDSLDARRAQLIGFSLAVAPGRACYVPLRHGKGGDMLASSPPVQMAPECAFALLRPLLEDPTVLKVMHHAKYDLTVLARSDNGGFRTVMPIDDTMMISYAMAAGRHGHGMDELAVLHLNHAPISYEAVTGKGRSRVSFAAVPLDRATAYAAEDADITLRLWLLLKPRLREERALALYEQVERRLISVLQAMEEAGIRVDGGELARIGEEFAARLRALEKEIHALAGRPFNLASPKQLGEVLFEEMKLRGGRKGKSGAYSTDAAVLEELAAQGVALAQRLLEWRQLAKLKSTYVEGLASEIDPQNGRVHTSFGMAQTSTGRLSSNNPNLQNIPIRSEEGLRIRRAFVAAPGHLLLSADYSQIELRLLAHLAEVPSLRQAFARGEDIHARTAAEIFSIPLDQVDREARRRAKTINFGIIYGMSPYGLAARLGIPPAEARAIIDAYFARYPGIRQEMERLKEEARTHGFVRTPFGRKLWIPDIAAKDPGRRGAAERAAINAPFQGGAAEIIKRAMVRLPRALTQAGLSARMLLQVHDELVFEVPEAEVEPTARLVKTVMEGVATLKVPLAVEIGVGRNWAEAH